MPLVCIFGGIRDDIFVWGWQCSAALYFDARMNKTNRRDAFKNGGLNIKIKHRLFYICFFDTLGSDIAIVR
jgi:hypothetical protein